MTARNLFFTVIAFAAISAPAKADQPTVIRIEKPVSIGDAIEVAERLGQIEFAISKCGLKGNRDILDLMLKKQMEGGAGGNMQASIDGLNRKSKSFGVESVCKGLFGMFGPKGSVIVDAVRVP